MGTRRILLPALAVLVTAAAPDLARAEAATPQFVRFATSLGNIDVRLLPQDAPASVANFLSYVQSGAYAQTFFDRSVPGFVIQGGSHYVDAGVIKQIPQQPAVVNEPRVSNTRGTLAMAKLNGQPGSATDAWFFNLADNSSNLDNQNGGFTVFGVVLDPNSLAVMDAVAGESIADFSSLTSDASLTSVPVQNLTQGQTPTTANLIMSPITVLTDDTPPAITITAPTSGQHFAEGQAFTPQYSCDDGNGTGVQSCTADSVPLDTNTFGQHTFYVTATDFAGNTSTESINYAVDEPGFGGPGGSPGRRPAAVAPTLAGSLTASRTGRLAVPLRCRGRSRCAGRITLSSPSLRRRGRPVSLGSARYSIAAGRLGRISLRLPGSALTLLRRHRGALKVRLALSPSGGKTRTVSTRLRLARR